MRIYTVFDDGFIQMGKSFIYSALSHGDIPICACLPSGSKESIQFCKDNNIEFFADYTSNRTSKQISRLLKMSCADIHADEEPIAYMDADIIFQNDPRRIEDLNPNYLWVLSKREGHQTTLRTWKRHYFSQRTVDFARSTLPFLTDLSTEKILESPVRNCGVIYGNRSIMQQLLRKAKEYYLKLLEVNSKKPLFSDSDQLCFLIAFHEMEHLIKELPVQFNRMPYHQSFDFKDLSCFMVPDNVVLHLNRCKNTGDSVIKSWSRNKKPTIIADDNTRSGIVIPMQTSNIAERAIVKNIYSLAVSNCANIYRDEDVGFPIANRIAEIDKIRNELTKERPAYDKGLFFIINDHLFMIDHGEHIGNRAAWLIGKHVTPDQLTGIFVEQMDIGLDISKSKIPIMPLTYGTKQPKLWINQGMYHDLGINGPKKYSVHFIGNFGTNNSRKLCASKLSVIPGAKIEDRNNSHRLTFDEYMRDIAAAQIVWCPPGGRPKTHREIEAMCCEVAVMMPQQNINEPEMLRPDVDYICIKQDHSDAANKAKYYLDNLASLAAIARNGRMWYERNASDNARAKYILDKSLEAIEKK